MWGRGLNDESDEIDERESECASGVEINSMSLLEYLCGTNVWKFKHRVDWCTLSF